MDFLGVNWVGLNVENGNVKDAMSRYLVVELEKAGVGIASATYDIVGFPPIEIRHAPAMAPARDNG